MDKTEQDQLKKEAATKAAKIVKPNSVLGVGTGSTVAFFIDALGERKGKENFNLKHIVTTSNRSKKQLEGLGFKVDELADIDQADLTVDGADRVDDNLDGIKGGGGALTLEKNVAINSKKIIWIVDESKLVHHLSGFPLPVEVIPFGAQHVFNRLEKKGYKPTWRMDGDQKYRTDENNYIIDLHLGEIDDPKSLADELIHMVGIVETGLFLNRVNDVIVGTQNGPKVLHAR